MEWEHLYSNEKEEYLSRAKKMIENGQYKNFEIEELAIMIFNSYSNSDRK